jgi:hypothetical protein
MNNRTVVARLIEIANILDSHNLVNESDEITRIAQDFSSSPSFDYLPGTNSYDIEGPDDYRADDMMIRGDQFESENELMMELARAEAFDRINQIVNNPNPSEKEIEEYNRLLQLLDGSRSEEDFKQNILDSGANIIDDEDIFNN